MAVAQSVSKSGLSILEPLERQNLSVWSGAISINFLDPNNTDEVNRYGASNNALQYPYPTLYRGISSEWQSQIQKAAALFSRYANITFDFNDDINANYLVGDLSGTDTYGYWNFPENKNLNVGFGVDMQEMAVAAEKGGGSDRLYTFVHELGHAVGLSHPFASDNGHPVGTSASSPPPYTAVQTVMSYDISATDGIGPGSAYGLAVTPMALDIAALQRMYGAAATYTSDTSYALTDPGKVDLDLNGDDGTISIGRAYYSIWDSGGTADKIEYSGGSNSLIDLNSATLDLQQDSKDITDLLNDLKTSPGWSQISTKTQNEILSKDYHAGGFFSSLLTSSGDRVAGGYTIANGAIIEEAYGGTGNDFLIGNSANNKILGGKGFDNLFGGDGADYLDLGGGNSSDQFSKEFAFGGNGSDYIVGGESNAVVAGGSGDDYYDFRLNFLSAGRPRDIEVQLSKGWGHDYIEQQSAVIDGNTYTGTGVTKVNFLNLNTSDVSFLWDRKLVSINEFTVYGPNDQPDPRRVETYEGNLVLLSPDGDSLFLGDAVGSIDATGSVAGAWSFQMPVGTGSLTFKDKALFSSYSNYDSTFSWSSFQPGAISSVYTGAKSAYEQAISQNGTPFIAPPESVRQNFSDGSSTHLRGTADRDRIYGTDADETVEGLEGDDILQAAGGNDLVSGGLGDDLIEGGSGNDTLSGGDGADSLSGDDGDDIFDGGAGDDVILGGIGMDTVTYQTATAGVSVDLSLSGAQDTEGAGTDTISEIENLIGSDFDDCLMDGPTDNIIAGGLGIDKFLIRGSGGSKTISDFNYVNEKVEFRVNMFDSGEDVFSKARQSGADVIIDLGGIDKLILKDVVISNLTVDNFVVPPPTAKPIEKPDIIKDESELNYTFSAAISIGNDYDLSKDPNIAFSDTIPHATVLATAGGGGNEFYKIDADANSRGIFDIDSANFDTILQLFDSDGNLIASNDDSYDDPGSAYGNSLIDYTFQNSGHYYLVVSSYDNPDNIELGSSYTLNISVVGRNLDYPASAEQVTQPTFLYGTGGADALTGNQSDDVLSGGGGDDLLTGGGGSNVFIFGPASGQDTVTDFKPAGMGHDLLQFDHTIFADASSALAAASQVGSDVVLTASATDTITLKNTQVGSLTSDDFRIT